MQGPGDSGPWSVLRVACGVRLMPGLAWVSLSSHRAGPAGPGRPPEQGEGPAKVGVAGGGQPHEGGAERAPGQHAPPSAGLGSAQTWRGPLTLTLIFFGSWQCQGAPGRGQDSPLGDAGPREVTAGGMFWKPWLMGQRKLGKRSGLRAPGGTSRSAWPRLREGLGRDRTRVAAGPQKSWGPGLGCDSSPGEG